MSPKLDKINNISAVLDITADLCPMTFVKSRLFIEKQKSGEIIEIRLSSGEPLENLPQALTLDGHTVVSLRPLDEEAASYQLILQLGPDN